MNRPALVFSINYAGTDYSITMSRTAWEFREYQKPASCAFGSWYSLEDLFENIKEHYPQTVYETLLSQLNEIKDRIGDYPLKADTLAGTHKVMQA